MIFDVRICHSILEMCVGEKKTLIIPPELGYGSRGAGKDIPGGATLRFVVDLLGINGNKMNAEPSSDPNVFAEMDANRDLKVSYNEMAHWFLTMHPDKLDAIPRGIFEREDKNGVSYYHRIVLTLFAFSSTSILTLTCIGKIC